MTIFLFLGALSFYNIDVFQSLLKTDVTHRSFTEGNKQKISSTAHVTHNGQGQSLNILIILNQTLIKLEIFQAHY
jgi:hypothetical protein